MEKDGDTSNEKEAIIDSSSAISAVLPVTARSGEKPTSLTICATFKSGRLSFHPFVWELADQAEGEMGIAVCGPLELCKTIRMMAAVISDERAVHKGTGAQGMFLHVESFGW